jgi:lipoic acid synthetase
MELPNRLPPWFKIRLTTNERQATVQRVIRDHDLHTVCQSAACPNRTECWNDGTATFMILGDICTRGCRFCNVRQGSPNAVDLNEPERVACAVRDLHLDYAVITSVTRDDLADGGAGLFAATIRAIRAKRPSCLVEMLIPDFQGSSSSLDVVLNVRPDILNHNVETVPSQYPRVRPQADYQRSLELLGRAHAHGILTKSGLMLGLGEEADEVITVMHDLRNAECSILTLGQYLQPRKNKLPVERYIHPYEFESFRKEALSLGFRHVAAGPLVRSSYHAKQFRAGGDMTGPALKWSTNGVTTKI